MQKKISTLLLLLVFLLGSCSPSSVPGTSKHSGDLTSQDTEQGLIGKISIPHTIIKGGPVLMTFVVYNKSDSVLRFCKWHTPFEPFMSNYLEITMESGETLAYQGPLAKRIMPPPASSYMEVKSKDSVVVTVDLRKAFTFSLPGKYIVTYSGQNISGIIAAKPESFIYQ